MMLESPERNNEEVKGDEVGEHVLYCTRRKLLIVTPFPCSCRTRISRCHPVGNELPWRMPYRFPHEDLFAFAVGALIVGLLLLRVGLARRRRRRSERPV